MATSTAQHAARSGFGSTAESRAPVVHGPRPAPGARRPAPRSGQGPNRPRTLPRPPQPRRRAPAGRPAASSRRAGAPFGFGPVRTQHMLMGEMITVLVLLVLEDVMADGDVTMLPVQATATAGLFLVLALASTVGRNGERVATAFGGLVVLAVLVKRWAVFAGLAQTLATAWGRTYTGKSAVQPTGATDVTASASTPGPPISAPAPSPFRHVGTGRDFAT